MFFRQPAFEKRPRIYAWRGVPLKIHKVGRPVAVAAAEKVIEPDFVQGGRRGERGDVAADIGCGVGLHNHRHRVPSNKTFDAPLQFTVARIGRLSGVRNRVDVWSIRGFTIRIHAKYFG